MRRRRRPPNASPPPRARGRRPAVLPFRPFSPFFSDVSDGRCAKSPAREHFTAVGPCDKRSKRSKNGRPTTAERRLVQRQASLRRKFAQRLVDMNELPVPNSTSQEFTSALGAHLLRALARIFRQEHQGAIRSPLPIAMVRTRSLIPRSGITRATHDLLGNGFKYLPGESSGVGGSIAQDAQVRQGQQP